MMEIKEAAYKRYGKTRSIKAFGENFFMNIYYASVKIEVTKTMLEAITDRC